ncbi:GDSL-type esterase/lipase family protein [Streptomyces sp. NPDC060194]|uniref:GDSL-type esterase/lipase family protein n=1 Tax=Streptomyces sp. NPDC060194 TaxID=3347069 RepID=UPI003665EEDD
MPKSAHDEVRRGRDDSRDDGGRNRRGSARRPRAVLAVALTAVLAGGALAGCDATGGNKPAPTPSPTSSKPAGPTWNTAPASVAAVGDSITAGFDVCTLLADCPEASWATGTRKKVKSLSQRLLGADAKDNSWNYAVSGARMEGLTPQVQRAVRHEPELLTVLMGANDACREDVAYMTPVADFRRDFESALRTVRKDSPKTQVYVSSVPDLKRLWSQGRTNPESKKLWSLGVCAAMLANPDATDAKSNARRDAVRQRVVEYNEVLRDACATDALCRFDPTLFDYKFTLKQLSEFDYFHPNIDGQAKLAEVAYENVTSAEGPA